MLEPEMEPFVIYEKNEFKTNFLDVKYRELFSIWNISRNNVLNIVKVEKRRRLN
jgi:hypothetical protein